MPKNNLNNTNRNLTKCILCGKTSVINLDKIDADCINEYYLNKLGFSVKKLFKNEEIINYLECQKCAIRFFKPVVLGDDNYYQKLESLNWYYEDNKYEYKYATKYIKNKNKVLDIGCGEGKFADLIPSANFTGLELNSKAKEIGLTKGITILSESVESHQRKWKNKYDVVTAFQVLEHIPNQHSFLRSSFECLKRNGVLIIAVPSEDSFVGKLQDNVFNIPPHHQTRWTDTALRSIALIFNAELLKIHHEPLSRSHTSQYYKSLLEERIFNFRKMKIKIFNCSSNFKSLSKFTYAVAILFKLFSPKMQKDKYGHSVIAIYRKK